MITTLISIVNTLAETSVNDYPVNYKITDKAHVFVFYVDDTEPEVELVQVAEFTAGADNEYKVNAITESGFNVELRDTYTAADDRKISIRRTVPLTQEVEYPPGNDFPGSTHERALDKLTAIVQQFNEVLARQIGMPLSEDAETMTLPNFISNYYLGLDGDNNLIWKIGTFAPGNDEIKDSHIDWGTGANQVSAVDMPIADAGGIITATEVEGALQENRAALDVEEAALIAHISTNEVEHSNISKGLNSVVLTNYDGIGLPAIAANSVCEINGSLYTNPSEVVISGSTANTTWYDILLTPSGSTFTASFVATETGVWSDSKQGLYSGNNRVVASAYRDSSDADWIHKNVLIVINRTVKLKLRIGDWDMDATTTLYVSHGLTGTKIRSLGVFIREDSGLNDTLLPIDYFTGSGARSYTHIDATQVRITRGVGGIFDGTNYDETSYNRGWIIIEYEV